MFSGLDVIVKSMESQRFKILYSLLKSVVMRTFFYKTKVCKYILKLSLLSWI